MNIEDNTKILLETPVARRKRNKERYWDYKIVEASFISIHNSF
jgi:hypothetical protein